MKPNKTKWDRKFDDAPCIFEPENGEEIVKPNKTKWDRKFDDAPWIFERENGEEILKPNKTKWDRKFDVAPWIFEPQYKISIVTTPFKTELCQWGMNTWEAGYTSRQRSSFYPLEYECWD